MKDPLTRILILDQTHLKLVSRVMDVPVGLVTVSEYPDLRRHDTLRYPFLGLIVAGFRVSARDRLGSG